jgi:hypothetical protein
MRERPASCDRPRRRAGRHRPATAGAIVIRCHFRIGSACGVVPSAVQTLFPRLRNFPDEPAVPTLPIIRRNISFVVRGAVRKSSTRSGTVVETGRFLMTRHRMSLYTASLAAMFAALFLRGVIDPWIGDAHPY